MKMQRIITIWNNLLKKMLINDEDTSYKLIEESLNSDLRENSIKKLKKLIDKKYKLTKNNKELIIQLFSNDLNNNIDSPLVLYVMENYQLLGFSEKEMLNEVMSDGKHAQYIFRNIMHDISFYGHTSQKVNKKYNNSSVIYSENLFKNDMPKEFETILQSLTVIFNMKAEMHPKLTMSYQDLDLSINKESSVIQNNYILNLIKESNGLNFYAKESYLTFDKNDVVKQKWLIKLAEQTLINHQHSSPYELMKSYLKMPEQKYKDMALLILLVGSHSILKDITISDINELSNNFNAPYHLKFMNKFFSTSKTLYENTEILEILKNESKRIDKENKHILYLVNDLGNIEIKEKVESIIDMLDSLNKLNVENKAFVKKVEDILENLIEDSLMIKELMKHDNMNEIKNELLKIDEFVKNALKSQCSDNINDISNIKKVLKKNSL